MSDPLEIRTESERKSMRPTKRNSVLIFVLVTTMAVCATLKSISTIDLPGPTGKRFDYLTIDYDDHYLLSAHLAAGLLYAIDLRTNRESNSRCAWGGRRGVRSGTEEGLHLKCRGQHDWGHRPQTNKSHQEAADGS